MKKLLKTVTNKIKEVDVKKQLQKSVSKIRKIRINPAELSAIAIVLVLSCIVIVPSLVKCVINRNAAHCSHHIDVMLGILSNELEREQTQGGTYWHDTIKNGNYQKLVSSLNDKTKDHTFSPSDYYIQTGDETIFIMCKKHKDQTEHSIHFSRMRNVEVELAEKPYIGGQIAYITVSGPDTYYQGDILDPKRPKKTVFSGREADKAIQNLKVYAVYIGGFREELPRGQYTIMTDRLNMNKSGQTHLIVKYNSASLWDNSVYAPFVIDVIGTEDVAPLIVDGGNAGKFELAAWDWADYVAEASAEPEGKDFGASIVRYNGQYYYFPEGMRIVNSNRNNSPHKSALDTADPSKPAYSIAFDRTSVITNSSAEPHKGSVKIENELVYIWNDTPLREVSDGWTRVYCELRKY